MATLVYMPIDYLVKEDTVLQPDMLVVCRGSEVGKPYLNFPPSLVCEVLSLSIALKDRHTKYNIYETQKIPYYLIISPKTGEVEIYALEAGKYVLTQKGKDIKASFQFEECMANIDFQKIWM